MNKKLTLYVKQECFSVSSHPGQGMEPDKFPFGVTFYNDGVRAFNKNFNKQECLQIAKFFTELANSKPVKKG